MLNIGQTGMATLLAVMGVVAVAGGAVGTPVIVDSVADPQPDSPWYALERAGERIKELTYAGGQDWNMSRAQERLQEYQNVANKEVANNHIGLIDEAESHLVKAIRETTNSRTLERARESVREHTRVLERIRDKAPEDAKQAIERALIRSRWQERVLENIADRLERSELAPGWIKKELQGEDIGLGNLEKFLENVELPPGILKQILENRDIPVENLRGFLEGKKLSPGILWQILDDAIDNFDSAQFENFIDILENKLCRFGSGEELRERIRERLEIRLENLENTRERIRERIENRLDNFDDIENKIRERLENHLQEIEDMQNRLREMIKERRK